MDSAITFRVNGQPHTVHVDPDMPLLYALRDDLGLSNPHFGCGLAQCGACTVHLDGDPVRSCVLPMSAVDGHEVVTLAGIGTPEHPHPIQQAYIDEQVPQCGYCINGWMMYAAAFLRDNKDPTDQAIRDALTGLKCRCGTHVAILRAVARAARAGRRTPPRFWRPAGASSSSQRAPWWSGSRCPARGRPLPPAPPPARRRISSTAT